MGVIIWEISEIKVVNLYLKKKKKTFKTTETIKPKLSKEKVKKVITECHARSLVRKLMSLYAHDKRAGTT